MADRGTTLVGHEKNNKGNTDSAYIWKLNGNNAIVDDGGDGGKGGKIAGGKVTQNTENISWFDSTPADGSLATGKYDVILEAWSADGVTLVGTNHVVFDVA